MNYYPYQNYLYGNNNNSQMIVPTLQGKVVDSAEMVKVTEVPFGGFGVFPKGDLSEIYVKSWNNNGTTQINTYKPVQAEEVKEIDPHKEIMDKIEELSQKIDNISGNAGHTPVKSISVVPTPAPAKDVRVNAY